MRPLSRHLFSTRPSLPPLSVSSPAFPTCLATHSTLPPALTSSLLFSSHSCNCLGGHNSVLAMDWFGNETLYATPLSNITISGVNDGQPVAAVQNVGNFSFAYLLSCLVVVLERSKRRRLTNGLLIGGCISLDMKWYVPVVPFVPHSPQYCGPPGVGYRPASFFQRFLAQLTTDTNCAWVVLFLPM